MTRQMSEMAALCAYGGTILLSHPIHPIQPFSLFAFTPTLTSFSMYKVYTRCLARLCIRTRTIVRGVLSGNVLCATVARLRLTHRQLLISFPFDLLTISRAWYNCAANNLCACTTFWHLSLNTWTYIDIMCDGRIYIVDVSYFRLAHAFKL